MNHLSALIVAVEMGGRQVLPSGDRIGDARVGRALFSDAFDFVLR
jgi:hypothetical protein